jgi:hypothetical protein
MSIQFLDGIPQPLYKYRIWQDQYGRRILTDNEIYLASPDQFNDPFENSYPFKYKEEQFTPDNIFLKLSDTGRKQWPYITDKELHKRCYERQHSGAFDNGHYWKELYEEFREENNKIFGIYCLTSKRDNLLMWSHYTNSHYGFCVGLDKFVLYDVVQGSLGPAIYDSKFPELDIFEKSAGVLTRLLSTKSKEWAYEDEYRLIKVSGARKICGFPNKAILEIILGHKMPEKDKDEIMEIANTKFPHAQIFQSQISLGEFKLDMIPIIR